MDSPAKIKENRTTNVAQTLLKENMPRSDVKSYTRRYVMNILL